MAAIPTVYRDIRFRSRLEATWAVFFDYMRMPWKYEPIDLAGYIPDFILPLDPAAVLIEVKPLLGPYALADEQAVAKIEQSGWAGPAMIVGCGLYPHPSRPEKDLLIGWSSHYESDWQSLVLAKDEDAPTGPFDWFWSSLFVCAHCHLPSFELGQILEGCCRCRANVHTLDYTTQIELRISRPWVEWAWAEAQNKTQWRGRDDGMGQT